jgi:L-Ala-D/L-Glu epimerase
MIIEDAVYRHYTVPFRMPFTTSRGLQQSRRGVLLRVQTDTGITGYGEAAALPSFGTGQLSDVEGDLRNLLGRITGIPVADARELLRDREIETMAAPARFAVDTALLDIESEAAGLSISRYLKADAASSVPLNATISDMDIQGAATAASYAAMAGYSAIKMKVGAFSNPEEEIQRVAAVREAIGPDVALRLDVNGRWSLNQAIDIANRLAPYDIAYLEQPLPASDIRAIVQLHKKIRIPIAADEAASSRASVENLIELQAVDAVIIKAGVIGSISAAREIIDLATAAGIQVVVTTGLETGVAITAALHLAATLPKPVSACGLATGTLLETDQLVDSPRIRAGQMIVPVAPGLGVEPVASVWE